MIQGRFMAIPVYPIAKVYELLLYSECNSVLRSKGQQSILDDPIRSQKGEPECREALDPFHLPCSSIALPEQP